TARDAISEGMTLMVLSAIAFVRADFAAAEPFAAGALRLARAERDFWNESFALAQSGYVASARGTHERAVEFLESALAIARQVGNPPSLAAYILDGLGEVGTALAQLQQARDWLFQSLEFRYENGEIDVMPSTVDRLAAAEAASGHVERAFR